MGCYFYMKISIEKLLEKMERELQHAKTSSRDENLREKIYSIKILCEVILEGKAAGDTEMNSIVSPSVYQPAAAQPVSMNQAKKMQTDDGANGDSLFDF